MSEGIFTEADRPKTSPFPDTPEKKLNECTTIGLRVFDAVDILKQQKVPTIGQIPLVRFCADLDYDIHIMVKLAPKKSKKQIGEEMFNGTKR